MGNGISLQKDLGQFSRLSVATALGHAGPVSRQRLADQTSMCVMALLYKTARGTPLLVATNREERFDRPTQVPKIQPGSPRVICGIDRQAGGTWLGVNQHGLFVAVTSRPKSLMPEEPRSRGLLCRELLDCRGAKEAAKHAATELATGVYAGANYVCADSHYAAVVYGGNRIEIVELAPGLHVLSNGDLDDVNDPRHEYVRRKLTLHTLDSAVTFLAVASRAFSRKADPSGQRGIVVTGGESGTVSSTLLALSTKIQRSTLQYAPGPPCDVPYDDLSALLRQVLSAEKGRNRAEGGAAKAKNGDKRPSKSPK